MTPNEFIALLTNEIKNVNYKFIENQNSFQLFINKHKVYFNKVDSQGDLNPKFWFKLKHKNGQIHELGLICTILLLSKKIKKRVIFYDIGSLYGYFSCICHSLFKKSKIILIEGNPLVFKLLKKIINHSSRYKLINAVLSNKTGGRFFYIDRMSFIESEHLNGFINFVKLLILNLIKKFFNIFKNNYFIVNLKKYNIQSTTLINIFEKNYKNFQEIYKIDTEGYQSIFLPPYVKNISERDAIVLMEFDSKKKMKHYGLSNNEILKLFIDMDYHAFWMDHRNSKEIVSIKNVSNQQDKNSLCILIPNKLLKSGFVS